MDLEHSKVQGAPRLAGDPQAPASLVDRFEVKIRVRGLLDEEQRQRLEYIAGRCQVRRTLEGTPQVHESVEIVGS